MKSLLRTVGASLLAMAVVGAQARPTLPAGTARIAGVVVDQAGTAVSGASVNVRGEKNEEGPRITTGADGRFLFDALPAVPIRIDVAKAGSSGGAYGRVRRTGTGITLTPGTDAAREIRIVLWPSGGDAVITGRVVDELGDPIANVPLRALARSAGGEVSTFLVGQTNDRGVYSLAVNAGTYIIETLTSGQSVPAPGGTQMRRAGTGPLTSEINFLTDPDGRFVLFPRVMPPAPDRQNQPRAYAMAFHGGATPDKATAITVAGGATHAGADITLHAVRGVRLSGVVIGPRGPVEGALLRLTSRYQEDLPAWAGVQFASSDRNGRFMFVLIAAGSYVLDGSQRLPPLATYLDSRGFPVMGMNDYTMIDTDALALHQTLDVDADRNDLSLSMTPGTRVIARVVTDNGTPLDAAALQTSTVRFETPGALVGAAARALEPGRFLIQAPPGSYYVRANPPRGFVVVSIVQGAQDLTDRRIAVGSTPSPDEVVVTVTNQPARISGAVVDGSGQPSADAAVVLFPVDRTTWGSTPRDPIRLRILRTTTGQYSFENLAPGAYFVAAVDDAVLENWPDAALLTRISTTATRVSLPTGPTAGPVLTRR